MPSERAPLERLHPTSLVFSLGAAARRLLLPGIVLFYASRGGNAEIWLMVLFVPTAIAALVRYWSYRYRLGEEEMVVREGIVTRNERHIPYSRVQNIDLVRNPVHRLLGVAEVHLQTASGDKPEAVLRVLSLEAIDELRAQIFRGRQEGGTQAATAVVSGEPAARPLLHLPPREIVLAGLISNRGMAVVAAAMGLVWQLDLWDMEEWAERLPGEAERLAGEVAIPGPLAGALATVSLVVVALVLLRMLSVIWATFKYHRFTLTRRGDDLRAEYGLFTRVTATIPMSRIQLLSVGSGPLHRLFGRAIVQVETAGGASGGEGEPAVNRLWLAPLIRQAELLPLLQEVLPEARAGELDWRRLPRRAGRRVLVRGMIVAALIALPGFVGLGLWGALTLVVTIPLAVLHARLYLEHTAWALGPRVVAYRSGWWRRRLSIVRFNKIQSIALRESPFDRRHHMAALAVDTAGAGRVGHRVAIRYLAATAAREMLDRLSVEADRTAFRW